MNKTCKYFVFVFVLVNSLGFFNLNCVISSVRQEELTGLIEKRLLEEIEAVSTFLKKNEALAPELEKQIVTRINSHIDRWVTDIIERNRLGGNKLDSSAHLALYAYIDEVFEDAKHGVKYQLNCIFNSDSEILAFKINIADQIIKAEEFALTGYLLDKMRKVKAPNPYLPLFYCAAGISTILILVLCIKNMNS